MSAKNKLSRHVHPRIAVPTKRLSRRFKLTLDVPLFQILVEDVLASIENDTLKVFRPDDEDALKVYKDADDVEVINRRGNVPVSVREWLCVGCQWIGCSNRVEDKTLAFYKTNADQTLWPWPVHLNPLGPAAFIGEIHLLGSCLPESDSESAYDAFRFTVAHELVHSFDMLRFLVPAFQNWRTFFKKVLGEGSRCDTAAIMFDSKRRLLDNYGSEQELAMVAEFWPSKARTWFEAHRG